MKIAGSIALVTGANGGIGRQLVAELLKRDAAKIYVAARKPHLLEDLVAAGKGRVVAIGLDVTDEAEVQAAARAAGDVTLLINNAGVATGAACIATPGLSDARQEMDVNYFGPLSLSRAFAPILKRNGGGAILNILSFLSLVTLPTAGTYSASKAAALSMTRGVRAELAAQHTQVVAAMPVQVETEMGKSLPEPRLSPQVVASEVLDAIESGTDEVFPGDLSRNAAQAFAADPAGLQAYMAQSLPVAS